MVCPVCNGTGRLPAIGLLSGKPIPNASIYCFCQHDEAYQPEARPEDFDFPCSDSFRGFYQGEPAAAPGGPGGDYELLGAAPAATEPLPRYDHLKGQLIHLQNKLNEHIDASKKSASKRGQY